MFAYCLNNPPLYYDNQGREAVRIDLADGDKNGDGIPDEPVGGSSGSGGTGSSIQVVAGASGQNGFGGPQTNEPVFPEDPNNFNPNGLEQKVRVEPGTGRNGGIIHWVIPGTDIVIFEWNEDYKHGSHYHALLPEWGSQHDKIHWAIGSAISEPWRSKYF